MVLAFSFTCKVKEALVLGDIAAAVIAEQFTAVFFGKICIG